MVLPRRGLTWGSVQLCADMKGDQDGRLTEAEWIEQSIPRLLREHGERATGSTDAAPSLSEHTGILLRTLTCAMRGGSSGAGGSGNFVAMEVALAAFQVRS